jgi:hypothetical protein
MKKYICFVFALAYGSLICRSQTAIPCGNILSVEVVPLNPQSGSYNYYAVNATLNQEFDQDVTVSGFIYDVGSPNTNNPFSLTITAGNISHQTISTFYQTTPSTSAEVSINNISPNFVSKSEVFYATSSYTDLACVNFKETFADKALIYLDSMSSAKLFLDGIITLNYDQLKLFLTDLVDNGISQTSIDYGIDSIQLKTFVSKFDKADSLYQLLAIDYYGPVDSISQEQQITLANTIAPALSEKYAPDDTICYPVFAACVGNQLMLYTLGQGVCTLAGWIFGSGRKRGCQIANALMFTITTIHCFNGHAACLNSGD